MQQAIHVNPAAGDFRAISLVSASHGVSHFYQLTLPSLFPFLAGDLGVSNAGLGIAMMAMYGISGVLQFMAGFLVDRHGARLVLIAGLSVMGAGVALIGVAGSFTGLLVAAILTGIGNSVFHPADFSIMNASVSRGRLGRAYSAHGIAGNIGWALAPLAGLVLSQTLGWRSAAFAAGTIGLAMALAVLLQARHLREDRAGTPARQPAGSSHNNAAVPVVAVFLCFLYFVLTSGALTGLQSFLPVILSQDFGIGVGTASQALSVYMLAGSCGILLGGWIADRSHRHDVIAMSGLAASTMAILLLVLSGGSVPGLVIPLLAAGGVSMGICSPSRDMIVRTLTPPGRSGKIYGIVYSGLDVGGVISPPLTGLVLDAGFRTGGLLLAAGLMFSAILPIAVLRGTREPGT